MSPHTYPLDKGRKLHRKNYHINNPEQKQPPEVLFKKGVLRSFAKFTAKDLCQKLFFNKVAGHLELYLKRDSGTEISKNTFFTEHLRATACASIIPLNTGRKLNIPLTFRRYLGHLLYILCTLRSVSRGSLRGGCLKVFYRITDLKLFTKYLLGVPSWVFFCEFSVTPTIFQDVNKQLFSKAYLGHCQTSIC